MIFKVETELIKRKREKEREGESEMIWFKV